MFRKIKRTPKKKYKGFRKSNSEQDDTKFYRCRVCGFPCNSETVETMEKSNEERTDYMIGNTINYDGGTVESVTVERGCPMCGSLYSK